MKNDIVWHELDKKEALKGLDSSDEGISNEEASIRLKKYGYNQIKKTQNTRPFLIFLRQFNSLLIYILIIAAVISALLDNALDSIIISIIIIINSSIGFF